MFAAAAAAAAAASMAQAAAEFGSRPLPFCRVQKGAALQVTSYELQLKVPTSESH